MLHVFHVFPMVTIIVLSLLIFSQISGCYCLFYLLFLVVHLLIRSISSAHLKLFRSFPLIHTSTLLTFNTICINACNSSTNRYSNKLYLCLILTCTLTHSINSLAILTTLSHLLYKSSSFCQHQLSHCKVISCPSNALGQCPLHNFPICALLGLMLRRLKNNSIYCW